jgi:hypothetical protein
MTKRVGVLALVFACLAITAGCGRAGIGASSDVVANPNDAPGVVLPANARLMSGQIVFPITHIGLYQWVSPPNPSVKKADVYGQSVGVDVDGGEVVWAPGGRMQNSIADGPNGLVMTLWFNVQSYTGTPRVIVSRAVVDTGKP